MRKASIIIALKNTSSKGSTAVDNAPPHPQTIRSGDFFVADGTEREPEQVKAGYHYGSGILPFAIFNSV